MEKSAEAFRTISEVADVLETPAHVLRFWESRFPQVRPVKRAGGRRYYRPSDVALLGGIRKLLHDDGMTIRGVQKILREQGVRHVAGLSPAEGGATLAGNPPRRGGPATPATATTTTDAPRTGAAAPAWPVAADPDAAMPGAGLLPDPDDEAGAGEAPMEVDAPTLPFGATDNIRPLVTANPAPPGRAAGSATAAAPPAEPSRPPAASLLRAMDALRARDNTSELRAVYTRLSILRDRLAERGRPSGN